MKKKYEKTKKKNSTYKIFLFVILIAIVSVVMVWLCYNVLPPKIITDITADGMIGFIGNIIGSSVAIFIAFFTAKYEKENIFLIQELTAEQRRNEILPIFNVKVKEIDECKYSILIENNSAHKAIDLYLFEYQLMPLLNSEKSIRKQISTEDYENPNYLFIDDLYLTENEFCLSELNFLFYDCDFNLISQVYKSYSKENNSYGYSLIKTSYELSEKEISAL